TRSMSCSGHKDGPFGSSLAAVRVFARSQWAVDLGALGGTRTPSLLIRSKIRVVQASPHLSDRPARRGCGGCLIPLGPGLSRSGVSKSVSKIRQVQLIGRGIERVSVGPADALETLPLFRLGQAA